MNSRSVKAFAILFTLLLAAITLAVFKGSVDIPWQSLFNKDNRQILDMRLVRVVLAMITGGALAVSGAALQAILRNPLAEPYLMGTSSGAGLGAVIAMISGIGGIYAPAIAFIGALFSVALVYGIARQNNRFSAQSLILSGVIVSTALSGVIVFLISVSGKEVLHGMTWWLWGSFEIFNIKLLAPIGISVMLSIVAIFFFSQDLNAISIGEEEAAHLGVRIEVLKKAIFIITSFITASLICVCGMIGFVGLVIPHIMRYLVGPNHKVLIPSCCIGGAAFMIFCDAVSRAAFPPVEIPIGVITAIIGAPIFIILLKRDQGGAR